MSISSILPLVELSPPEIDIIVETFSNSVVKKYLRSIAIEDTKELLELSALSKPTTEIATAHAIVQGKLSVISTLLSISTTSKE
jgi:hypothetical protein